MGYSASLSLSTAELYPDASLGPRDASILATAPLQLFPDSSLSR